MLIFFFILPFVKVIKLSLRSKQEKTSTKYGNDGSMTGTEYCKSEKEIRMLDCVQIWDTTTEKEFDCNEKLETG